MIHLRPSRTLFPLVLFLALGASHCVDTGAELLPENYTPPAGADAVGTITPLSDTSAPADTLAPGDAATPEEDISPETLTDAGSDEDALTDAGSAEDTLSDASSAQDSGEVTDDAAACEPECAESACGVGDGCGGTCACSEGESCVDGLCQGSCTPDCDAKVCGDDGCGGSCGGCGDDQLCTAGGCVEAVEVTFSVDMSCSQLIYAGGLSEAEILEEDESFLYFDVQVAGAFNDFKPTKEENGQGVDYTLSDDDGDGIWTGTFKVNANSEFVSYRFLVDNWKQSEELTDDAEIGAPCAFGDSRQLSTGSEPLTLELAVYGRCAACDCTPECEDSACGYDGCVGTCATCPDGQTCMAIDEAQGGQGLACATPITVSVSLDMGCSNLEPIPEVMAIVGSFNGWCGDCDPLYPIGGGLYDGTISMVEGQETQYRFVGLDYAIDEKDALFDEVSSGQGDCVVPSASDPGSTARSFTASADNTTLNGTYGSCMPCQGCGDGVQGEGEDCASCPQDVSCAAGEACVSGVCQTTCGDGVCGASEDCGSCESDCGFCESEVTFMLDTSCSLVEGASYAVVGSFAIPGEETCPLDTTSDGAIFEGTCLVPAGQSHSYTYLRQMDGGEVAEVLVDVMGSCANDGEGEWPRDLYVPPHAYAMSAYDTWGQCESCATATPGCGALKFVGGSRVAVSDLAAYDTLQAYRMHGVTFRIDEFPGDGASAYLFERVDKEGHVEALKIYGDTLIWTYPVADSTESQLVQFSSAELSAGTWHRVVIESANTHKTLYLDGALVETVETPEGEVVGGSDGGTYTIGAQAQGSSGFFGEIAQVFIYEGPDTGHLSDADLASLAATGPAALFGDYAIAIWDFSTPFSSEMATGFYGLKDATLIETEWMPVGPDCPDEAVCGDGLPSFGETCATCPDDVLCGAGTSCIEGICQADCAPSCANKSCGDDGCGGSCGTCPEGTGCTPDFSCDSCGDGICSAAVDEDCLICPEDCGPCPITKVTFQLDMSCANVSFEQVYVSGEFNGWCHDCLALSDEDEDGIYTATAQMTPGQSITYLYQTDGWTNTEDLSDNLLEGCVGGYNGVNANRVVHVPSSLTHLTHDTWGQCAPCQAGPGGCGSLSFSGNSRVEVNDLNIYEDLSQARTLGVTFRADVLPSAESDKTFTLIERVDAEGKRQAIELSSAGVYMVYSEGSDAVIISDGGPDAQTTPPIGGLEVGEWYYIAAVFEDELKQVYLNSNLLALSPTPGGTLAGGSGGTLTFGANADGAGGFVGEISDVFVHQGPVAPDSLPYWDAPSAANDLTGVVGVWPFATEFSAAMSVGPTPTENLTLVETTWSIAAPTCLGEGVCGDGELNIGESCDDGEENGSTTECPYGALSCVVCTDLCTFQEGEVGAYCGDGEVHELEDCQSCPSDASCQPGEICNSFGDCVQSCGDGECVIGETCENCPSDCTCTSDECSSADCPEGQECLPAGGDSLGEICALPVSVTLRLHLTSCDPGVGEPSPYISGQWNDFCEACEPMVDYDGSGIWNRTLTLAQGQEYRYFFRRSAFESEQSALLENLSANDNLSCYDNLSANSPEDTFRKVYVEGPGLQVDAAFGTCDLCPAGCGDAFIQPEEENCDMGNNNTDTGTCAYGQESCMLCSTGCQAVPGAPSYCGDGTLQGDFEVCDEGDANTDATQCPYGVESCTLCSTSCQEEVSGEVTGYCGDFVIEGEEGEACDDGVGNTDSGVCAYGSESQAGCFFCSLACQFVSGASGGYCGDGIAQDVEDCNACPSDAGCLPTETCSADGLCVNSCGDGQCQDEETCESCEADCGCLEGEACLASSGSATKACGASTSVTLNLDLSCVETKGVPSASVAGSWNLFVYEPMSDLDGDGIYTYTTTLIEGDAHSYSFSVTDADGATYESSLLGALSGTEGGTCLTTEATRALDVQGEEMTLSATFGACGGCPEPTCNSLVFDGLDDFVEVAHDAALNLTGSYTVEWWFKFGDPESEPNVSILSKRGDNLVSGYTFGANAEGQNATAINGCCAGGSAMFFNAGSENTFFEPAAFTSGWHHVAITHDASSGETRSWVDGVHKATTTLFNSLAENTETLWFGREHLNVDQYDNFSLAGVKLSSEVLYIEGQSYTPTYPLKKGLSSTLALWHTNEGQGLVLGDSSGHGLEGAISGATWANACPNLGESLGGPANPGIDCMDILAQDATATDGTYWIDPDGAGGEEAFEAYCDMTSAGGGWTLILNQGEDFGKQGWSRVSSTANAPQLKSLITPGDNKQVLAGIAGENLLVVRTSADESQVTWMSVDLGTAWSTFYAENFGVEGNMCGPGQVYDTDDVDCSCLTFQAEGCRILVEPPKATTLTGEPFIQCTTNGGGTVDQALIGDSSTNQDAFSTHLPSKTGTYNCTHNGAGSQTQLYIR